MVLVKWQPIHPNAILPTRATDERAYYDVYSAHNVCISPHSWLGVGTGLKVQPEKGYFIDIRPRSGMALKHGITVGNSPGVLDSDYGGELIVILINHSDEEYWVNAGDRIAQLNVMRVQDIVWTLQSEIEGTAGFGSTGK